MALRHREFPRARRAVPSRVGAHRRWPADAAQLPGARLMIPRLVDQGAPPRRPHRQTRPRRPWTWSCAGEAHPAQLAGLLDRPGDEGRAAGRAGRAGPDDAGARRAASTPEPTPSTPAAPAATDPGTFNISTAAAIVVAGAGLRSRQARQPIGVEPLRQRRRARSAGGHRHRAAGGGPARGHRGRHRASASRRPSIRRCATPPRPARRWACRPRSTCSGR